MKIVDVIDCVPGNAPDTNGRPISILTLAYMGELEQPLSISYEDSKRLVTKLLISLAAHDDEFASELLKQFPKGSRDGKDDEREDGDEEEAWKKT